MIIKEALCAYEPELFKTKFGFKGSSLSGVWQTAVRLVSGNISGIGLGVQSVLWSDSNVFLKYGEEESNKLMFSVTKYAAQLLKNETFTSPRETIANIYPECLKFAQKISGENVTETFVLNALVPVDFALWMLYQREHCFTSFDSIFQGTNKAKRLLNIPLITYQTPCEQIRAMAEQGTAVFKIKIGSDPEGNGDRDAMLKWDMQRIKDVHNAVKDVLTPYTDCGHPVYYLDANGRYDGIERLTRLIDFMDSEGVLERTVLFEEPFRQEDKIDLSELPVCFACDESAHSLNDVKERIALGYKAITLKPIAKTLSVSIEMAECARQNNVQCFCADLTVNPVMVQWNKNFAARLDNLKGLKVGVVESNGAQNYVNWEKMLSYLPIKDETFSKSVYELDENFYKNNGGIFMVPKHYDELFE